MGEYKLWTNEEDSIIKNKKRPNESWREFSERELPHRNPDRIRWRAKTKLGMRNDAFRSRKYFFNKNYWKVPNPENCYLAGFLSADGCLREYSKTYGNGYSLVIDLQISDSHVLETFKDLCGFTGPLQKSRQKGNSTTQSLVINIGMEWIDDLKNNFNIIPRKTHTLKPPNIKDEYLLNCFILGFLDGDGCAMMDNRGRVSVSAACASPDFADWLQVRINKIVENSCRRNKKRKRTTCSGYPRAAVHGNAACALIDYFRQFPLPKLDRKWNNPKIIDYIESQKLLYPDKFLTLEIPPQFR